jgi:aminoglycoside phosphotransferase (APT) family kinase protein
VTPGGESETGGTDPGRIAEGLADWLRDRLPGSGTVRLGPLEKPGSGLSAGTLLVEAHRSDRTADRVHSLVLRIPSVGGEGLFPTSDLARELAVLTLLDRAGVPVPHVIGLEQDPSVLGRPFLVTRRVEGRLIDSTAPYLSVGWLHDESEEIQSRIIGGFLGAMARIHRSEAGVQQATELGGIPTGGTAGALERWSRYLEWADVEGDAPDELYEALAWCRSNRPAEEPLPSLLWGDAQLANAVFGDDGSTRAILDFELAAIGPAELDLGWFLCLHDMTVARCGQDLPGFMDRRGRLAIYEDALGRPVSNLEWYEIFAAVCTASILVRMAFLLCKGGTDAAWLARSNPALDHIASLLA